MGKDKSHSPYPDDEWVLLRVLKGRWLEPRWAGCYKVIGKTSTAVQLAGKGSVW